MNIVADINWLTHSPHSFGVVTDFRDERRGMTLVELMVTMVVITILSSLSLAGLAVARTTAKRAKTVTTIQKLSQVILPYYEQYETRRPVISNTSVLAAMPSGRAYLTDAKQLAIRRLMTLELPERASDITVAFAMPGPYQKSYQGTVVGFGDVPPASRRFNQLLAAASNTPTSAELLHLIVTRGSVADPDIVAHFRDDEVRDTDGDGLPEFVDGWNRPIMFKRWATGFASPAQPIDGTLRNIDTLIANNGHRLIPLIYSAGVDGSYDIEAATPLSYGSFEYDPFRFDPNAPTSQTASPINVNAQVSVSGEMVLVPANAAPLTFTAQRFAGTSIANSFQTVGSPRDTDSPDGDTPNGILESADNIHNHDMTR
jgi:prepilin-type N-terminal cleavage/methylation domain-containing protein